MRATAIWSIPLLLTALPVGAQNLGAAGAAKAPTTPPTPAPSRRAIDAHRARVRTQGYRPYFSGSAPTATSRNSAADIVGLRRSARSKTFIPQAFDKALDWNRVGASSVDRWERDGGWKAKSVWEAPSPWKGASLTSTVPDLAAPRGVRTTWAERNPIRATVGTKRPSARK